MLDPKDPLPFEARRQNVVDFLLGKKVVYVRKLTDAPTDASWSVSLDDTVTDVLRTNGVNPDALTLYGGRDSFIPSYTGGFQTVQLTDHNLQSGTELRKLLQTKYFNAVESAFGLFSSLRGFYFAKAMFNSGIVYAATMPYPTSFQCVDCLVLHGGNVLLGRKPGQTIWQFPGGFVDVDDVSLEQTARRELMEETGICAQEHNFTYARSRRIQDYRYRGRRDAVMTALMLVDNFIGEAVASDDLAEVKWFPYDYPTAAHMLPGHGDLLVATLNGGVVK